MSQANVYNANIANATWYTDKAEIVSGGSPVSYNIYVMQAGNPTAGLIGSVTNGSNVMLTAQASASLVNATFATGTGVANTVTVVSVVNGQSLVMSANASATVSNGSYTVALGNPGNMYNNGAIVAPNGRQQIYVGAGNKVTISSSGTFTVREIGTASSATAGH
jgi:hypothetical protein